MKNTTYLTQLRTQLRDRQEAGRAHRQLARDLASYSSETQLSEMEAILSRYDDSADVITLRTILQRVRTAA